MIQSLDRGLRILDEISAGRRTLGEISESLDVHKSTTMRLLATLEQHHFVIRRDARSYELGRRISDLATFAAESMNITAAADGALQAAVDEFGAPGHVSRLTDSGAVVISVRDGRKARCSIRLGTTLKWTSSAAGRVHLAALPPVTWRQMIRSEVPRADMSEYLTLLDSIRRTGMTSLRDGPHERVAAAVRDHTGGTAAVLTLELAPSKSSAALPYLLEARDRASWT